MKRVIFPKAMAHPLGGAEQSEPAPTSAALDLDEVFRAYAGYVATIVLRILGQRDEVEDVVQDVFLSALGSLPRLRDPAALKGWLAAIAVRRASDRLRRRRLLLLLRLTRAAEPDPLPREASPEVKALCAHLYRCLEQVPVAQRVAWTLRHLEGERLDVVAQLCGCSLATVKRRIAAAQVALMMATEDGHDG